MKKLLPAFVLASMLLQPMTGVWTAAAAQTTHYGEATALGNGTVRTYVTVDSDAQGGMQPTALGVEFSNGALMNLPTAESDNKHCATVEGHPHCMMGHEFVLPLPEAALSATPFRWMMLNWNPYGHPPPGIYDPPHFDFHFYTMPVEQRSQIGMGMCEGPMPGPPVPVDCGTLGRAMDAVPEPLNPAGYINPGAVEPLMGAHLIDPRSPEFQGSLFTRTFIWGAFDADIIFAEPMITRDHILGQTAPVCDPIPQPQMFGWDGWYPTEYCIRVAPESGARTVSLEKFVQHQDRDDLVNWIYQQHLCRAAESAGMQAWAGSGLSISRIIGAVSMSDEGTRAAAVRALYRELLDRDPVSGGDCAGLRSWVAGPGSVGEIRAAIMGSAEYRSKHPSM